MSVKPSEEEEKYARAEDQRRIAQMRGEIQTDQATRDMWLAVAKAVGSENVDVGRRMAGLGFDADTARILFFVPLVEVAWADGKIGYEESYRLVDVVRKKGVRATSAAYDFLSKITLNRPSEAFFEGCHAVIKDLLSQMPASQRDQEVNTLADLCVQVAKASRGFFGFGAEVSPEERTVIQEIVSELGLDQSASAKHLLKTL
jgi:tellurite resistance protein